MIHTYEELDFLYGILYTILAMTPLLGIIAASWLAKEMNWLNEEEQDMVQARRVPAAEFDPDDPNPF